VLTTGRIWPSRQPRGKNDRRARGMPEPVVSVVGRPLVEGSRLVGTDATAAGRGIGTLPAAVRCPDGGHIVRGAHVAQVPPIGPLSARQIWQPAPERCIGTKTGTIALCGTVRPAKTAETADLGRPCPWDLFSTPCFEATSMMVKMDNQHKLIKGYRDLSQDEIDLMNEIKAKGEELGALCDRLNSAHPACDGHWVAIGKTHLQQGIMALVRAVARPQSF
jgi:hypothetical protein